MIIWVMYDIKNDKARTRIAKICQHTGLYRVQYSVFLGEIDRNDKDSLQMQIADLMDINIDRVYIFSMTRQELKDCEMLGQAFDKKLVTNEVKSLFL